VLRRLSAGVLLCASVALAACQTVPQSPRAGQPPAAPVPPVAAPAATPVPLPAPTTVTPPVETPPPALPGAPALLPPAGEATVRVALLLPLTGPNGTLGRTLFDAATLALFDAKRDALTLIVKDTRGTPEGAADAASAALSEGAELIIGPIFAAEVQAVAAIARERRVNVVAFSTDRQVAGDGVYLLGFGPEQQIERVVQAARESGRERFAALVPENAYGAAVEAAFRRAVENAGGALVKLETYPADSLDFTRLARRFADYDRRKAEGPVEQAGARRSSIEVTVDAPFDALLLPEGGQRLRALAPVLAYFDIDPAKVKFMGTGQWDQPGIGTEPALVGGWFAAPALQGYADFSRRFQAACGRAPVRIASIAYDAAALAAALSSGPVARRFDREALENPQGFAGYDGVFRFRADGLAERGLAVLEVQRGGFRTVVPAPERFELTPGQ